MQKNILIIFILLFFGFRRNSTDTKPRDLTITIPKSVEVPKHLLKHAKYWTFEDTILHTHNHIRNINILFQNAIKYLDEGIPEYSDTIEPYSKNKSKHRPAVSAKKIRKSLGIPENAWKNPEHKKLILQYIQERMEIHDWAKVNTSPKVRDMFLSPEFIKNYNLETIGAPDFHNFFINGLHHGFGVNPWTYKYGDEIRKDPSLLERINEKPMDGSSRYIQDTVIGINEFDDQVEKALNERWKSVLPPELNQDWFFKVGDNFEVLLDRTERTGNKVSIIEFGRKMIRESIGTMKLGKFTPFTNCNAKCLLTARLENDYQKVSTNFLHFKAISKKIFSELKKNGIPVDRMHPVRKFEIFILSNGEKPKLKNMSADEAINWAIRRPDEFIDLFPSPGDKQLVQKFISQRIFEAKDTIFKSLCK